LKKIEDKVQKSNEKFAYIKYFLYLCIDFEVKTQPKNNPDSGLNLSVLDFTKYWNV